MDYGQTTLLSQGQKVEEQWWDHHTLPINQNKQDSITVQRLNFKLWFEVGSFQGRKKNQEDALLPANFSIEILEVFSNTIMT